MGKISNTTKVRNRISELENKGFITRKDQRIIPTKKGFLVADTMPLYLLPD